MTARRAIRYGALRYFWPVRRRILLIAALSVIAAQAEAAALVLLAPVALAIAAGDEASSIAFGPLDIDEPVRTLIGTAAILVVLAALLTLLAALHRARMIAGWEHEERRAFVDEYLAADLPMQVATRGSDLQVSFASYVGKGGQALGGVSTAIKAAASLIIYLAASLVIDWRGTALITVSGLVFFGALLPITRSLKRTSTASAGVGLAFANAIGEAARAIRDVRVFRATPIYRARLQRISGDFARLQRRAAFLGAVTTPVYQYLGLLLTLGLLALAVSVDGLDLASVGAVALLLLRSLSYGQQLQSSYQQIVESLPYFERVDEIRRSYRERAESDGQQELGGVTTLALHDASYRYEDGTLGLGGVTVELGRGDVVGVVGPSGSGKSTLAQVILRMRSLTGGQYLVNGRSAAASSLFSFYRHVTLVPQRCELLDDTVLENIRMFDPQVSPLDVEDAARRAGVHDTIVALDRGYETILGPASRELSGGQVQRIAIARALVRRADVIVLDEPTSALDVHAEAAVQDAIDALSGQAIVVIIAHRLSTLSVCNRILAMADGTVESLGTMEEVQQTSAFFSRAIELGDLDSAAGARLAEDPANDALLG